MSVQHYRDHKWQAATLADAPALTEVYAAGKLGQTVTNVKDGLPTRTRIYNSAVKGGASLSHLRLPEGVTSIGDDAFYLPTTITEIGTYAFSRCANLQMC